MPRPPKKQSKIVQEQQQFLAKVEANLVQQEAHLKKQEHHCKTMEKNLELHRCLRVLAEERERLIEGSPCPLCGSSEHRLDEIPLPSCDTLAIQEELAQQQQRY